MNFPFACPAVPRVLLAGLLLLLASCASLPSATMPVEWQAHADSITALETWTLNGRLNVRQGRQSDTVNLNWAQDGATFSIRLSATVLGLGAVLLQGDDRQVLLEKAGEEPRLLPSLEALGHEYMEYEFPAAYLTWWVRGLPAPSLPAQSTLNEQNLLQTLVQHSPDGQRYELTFERYSVVDGLALPSRITLQSQGVMLRVLVDGWQIPPQQAR
jgi:outer membrane lipoprotein LolB